MRVVWRDQYRDSGYALLMEALAAGGNVGEALRHAIVEAALGRRRPLLRATRPDPAYIALPRTRLCYWTRTTRAYVPVCPPGLAEAVVVGTGGRRLEELSRQAAQVARGSGGDAAIVAALLAATRRSCTSVTWTSDWPSVRRRSPRPSAWGCSRPPH